MTWLTWRQARAQLLAAALAGAALCAWLLTTGGRLHRLTPSSLYDSLTPGDHRLYYTGVVVLAVAPAIVGAFWGAPMVAREIEDGTHRLIWTQSTSRTRWLATKLGLTALATVLVVGGISAATTWWAAPLDGAQSRTSGALPSRMTPVSFSMRGLVPAAWALLALALGVLLGLLLRRVLTAMAVTVVLVVAAQIAWPILVRPHLLPARTQLVVPSRDDLDGISISDRGSNVRLLARAPHHGDWILSTQLIDGSGRSAALPAATVTCMQPPPPTEIPTTQTKAPADSGGQDCLAPLAVRDYHLRVRYEPIARFWTLQWVEAGLLLLLSGGFAGAATWRIRRDVG